MSFAGARRALAALGLLLIAGSAMATKCQGW
jgi:hypothetical protein